MESSLYFSPIESGTDALLEATIGATIAIHTQEQGFPDIENAHLALIGVPDERGAVDNEGCSRGPDRIRQALYRLFPGDFDLQLVDLGNIRPGETPDDTHFALGKTVAELLQLEIVPVILGASQDLTFGNYLGYELAEQVVNLLTVDGKLDMGEPKEGLHARSYLSSIVLKQPNWLFNYTNVGQQTYLVSQEQLQLMDRLYFESTRLGQARSQLADVEPLIRNADMISIDISSVKKADAPGHRAAGPNGFYGEELCQLARYAGMSDKMTSFGIYEVNPLVDDRDQTSELAAQAIWCMIDGFYARKQDHPWAGKKDYLKYRVAIKDHAHELVFYKSLKSDRWWMDVPYPPAKKVRFQRHHLVPCTYADYQVACADEVPDKWWKAYQKLS